MLLPNTISRAAGLYRSECCGMEVTVSAYQKFPECNGTTMLCGKPDVRWTLLRRDLAAEARWTAEEGPVQRPKEGTGLDRVDIGRVSRD